MIKNNNDYTDEPKHHVNTQDEVDLLTLKSPISTNLLGDINKISNLYQEGDITAPEAIIAIIDKISEKDNVSIVLKEYDRITNATKNKER